MADTRRKWGHRDSTHHTRDTAPQVPVVTHSVVTFADHFLVPDVLACTGPTPSPGVLGCDPLS